MERKRPLDKVRADGSKYNSGFSFSQSYRASWYYQVFIYLTECTTRLFWIKAYVRIYINFLTPTGYVMHQQFNIQQLYALPTLYLCVLYLCENKQRLVPLTA